MSQDMLRRFVGEKQKRRLAGLLSLASAKQSNEPNLPKSTPSDPLSATGLPSPIVATNLADESIPVDAATVEWDAVQPSPAIEGIAADLNWVVDIPLDELDAMEHSNTDLSCDTVLRQGKDQNDQALVANAYPPLSGQAANPNDLLGSMPSCRPGRPSTSLESSGSSVAWQSQASFPAETIPATSIPGDSYIRVHRNSFLNAFMQNAMVLGYTVDCVTTLGCHLKSLWCPTLPQPQVQVGIRADWKENMTAVIKVAPDLAPTTGQLQHPHGIYFDIFPFSDFREKALALRAVRPKVFEEADLMRDLDTGDAMRCWGPTPWDQRSWEVQPWFLQKWWMLTGGEEGEMGSLSRWWRRLRGEV